MIHITDDLCYRQSERHGDRGGAAGNDVANKDDVGVCLAHGLRRHAEGTWEYWLTDDGLARIYEDFENGRINGPTYQQRLQAWVASWRKRLEGWRPDAEDPTLHDVHLLSTRA